ncbi:finger 839 [Octopus vulgaris]|uniref:Finger 839 n=1 Tax=Octopus vulgaris TaxID=6645 RepID=A0AA36B8Y8_OCTVU|nr:finger 839 [Octopus vulgaris]
MADQRSATGIIEQHNVVVVAGGSSAELPAMVVPTGDSLIVSEELTEQSVNQEQQQSEGVRDILQQTMSETVPEESLTSVKYAQSTIDNNNTSTESVVSVVGPAGDIVNSVVENSTVLQSAVTTETITSPSVTGSVSTVDTVQHAVNVVSSLSIPQVVHIAQPQVQESTTGSSQQERSTTVVVVSRQNDDKGHQVVDGVLVPEIHENVVVGANSGENQPDTNTDNSFVDGTGDFSIVTTANLSEQPSSLSETMSMSEVASSVTGVEDEGGSDSAATAVAANAAAAGVQETFHQDLVNTHTTTLPIHVITTNRVTTTNNNTVNNNNTNNDRNDLVHHQLQNLQQQQQTGDVLETEEEMMGSDIGTQNIVVEQQFVNNENGCLANDENADEANDNNSSRNGITPQNSISITLAPSNDESGAPLGSSQNPIRIIQQGNQYTPLQQLTTDQLQQIMQVVQQQQLARSTQAEGSSILYNPQTNTRIVYRVIYPSELHKSVTSGEVESSSSDGTTLQTRVETQSQGQQTVTFNQLQRRPYRRRNKEEEEKIDGPELSKEEKEERKKHRPRTRSGRVSKPPKHMVKDYKHIHVLDWDEDYDDSDGGYSDFKYSEDEEAERRAAAAAAARSGNLEVLDEPYIHPGLGSSKPKNFKCELCSKAYIGRAGLARHYRLNPSHGQLSAEDELELRNQVLQHSTVNGMGNSSGNLSEDSNTQDSLLGLSSGSGRTSASTYTTSSSLKSLASATTTCIAGTTTTTPTVTITTATTTTTSLPSSETTTSNSNGVSGGTAPTVFTSSTPTSYVSSHVTRGPGRRLGHHLHETPAKRKARLKELIKQCEDEELMEIVLPRLATVITVWEFLLMKVEKGRPSKPQIPDIFKEFENLHKRVQKICQKYLVPVSERDGHLEGSTSSRLNVQNSAVAKSLGLSVGMYDVKEVPVQEEKTFQYKLLTTDPSSLNITPGQTNKRTIELVTQEQLVSQTPNKKIRVINLNSADLSELSQFSHGTLPNPAERYPVRRVNNTNNLPQLSALPTPLPPPLPPPPPSSLPPVSSSLTDNTNNTQPLAVATNCDSMNSNDISNSSGEGSNSCKVAVSNCETVPVRTVVCVNTNSNNDSVGQLAQDGLNNELNVTTSLVNGINNANTTTVVLPVTVMTHPPTTEVIAVSSPLSVSSKNDTPGEGDSTSRKTITTPMDIGAVVGDIQTHSQQNNNLTSSNPAITSVTDSVDTSELVVNKANPLTSKITTVVTQSTPLTEVVSSPASCPVTHLSQIPDTAAQQTLQNLTSTTTTMVAAPVPCVEEHVVEVPVAMEQNMPISAAVSTASVLGLEHLNSSEAHTLKARTFESIEQQPTELVNTGQIIFEDSVVTSEQLVSQPNIFQTEDGIIIIQKPDGTTMQIQGEQTISLETVQAVFAMDTEDQMERLASVQQPTTDLEGQQ